jgi:serine/threonine-protein kinase
MARVWAARQHGQRGFTKLVAIKTILPHLAREAEFERMFLDEARIASGIHHPNVCEIYELGEEGSVLYLAMEWVNGEALVHILRGGRERKGEPRHDAVPIDPRLASRMMADAAAGVHSAHNLTDEMGAALNVVHRDVSPHNILLSAEGNVKVTDFGVAKALGQLHNATNAGQLRGKLAYMPPEQVAGNYVDRRSDVFALGCVLYEITTGRPPFVAEGEAQLMKLVSTGEFPRPTQIAHGYPEELESILLRAMAKDPVQRFGTAERFRLALEEWLARSGPVVTQSHVAVVVQQRIGHVIERRREKIRAASANPEAAIMPPPPTSSPSSSGVLSAPIPQSFALSAYSDAPPASGPTPSHTPSSHNAPISHTPSTQSSSGVQAAPAMVPISGSSSSQSSTAVPVAPKAPHPLRYLIAIGLGIVVAVALAIVGVVVMGKKDAAPPVPKAVVPVAAPSATAVHTAPAATTTSEPSAIEIEPTPSATTSSTAPAGTTTTTSTQKKPPALPANPYQ